MRLVPKGHSGRGGPSCSRRHNRSVEDERLNLIRSVYDRWAVGDFDTVDAFHPDVEVVWDKHMPDMDVDSGIEAFVKTVGDWFAIAREPRIAAEEIHEVGDRIVVFAKVTGAGRGSGVPMEMRPAHVWEIRDGRASRVVGYLDREEGLEAARSD